MEFLTSNNKNGNIKKISTIALQNPNYFFQTYNNGGFNESPQLRIQAGMIFDKLTRIKVPKGKKVIIYENNGKVTHIEIKSLNDSKTKRKYDYSVKLVINLFEIFAPHTRNTETLEQYAILRVIRLHYLPYGNWNFTDKMCAAFFNNPNNFA